MKPPPLPRWLIARLAPHGDRDVIVGDLDEEFLRRVAASGRAAGAWYWAQAAASIPSALRLRWRRAALLANLDADVRYAVRSARRHRGFTAAVVLTIALGAGTATAVLSVIEAVLIRPLPFANADRIVMLQEFDPARGGAGTGSGVSWADFVDLSQRTRSFAAIAGWDGASRILTGNGPPERLSGLAVTARFFDAIGVAPALGRAFTDADMVTTAEPVVILTHTAWTRRFAADPSIVGRAIRLGGRPTTVVGVLPQTFRFGVRPDTELWLPLRPAKAQLERQDLHWFDLIAALRPGVTRAQADEEVRAIGTGWKRAHPWHVTAGLRVISFRDDLVAGVRPALLVLAGAALLVLLAAAVSVSALIVSRAAGRSREMAVRASLGATRMRISRQMLIESLCLAAMGILPGLLLGMWAVRVFAAGVPDRYRLRLPYLDQLSVSPVAAVGAVLLTTLAIVCAGLAPAFSSRRLMGVQTLVTGLRATGSRAETRLRRVLAATQVALAVTLLAGAALIGRSVLNLTRVSPGFETTRLLVGQVGLPATRYPTPEATAATIERILDRVRAIPGVSGAETIDQLPLTGTGSNAAFTIVGTPAAEKRPETLIRTATPGYFRLMGIPVVSGRTFAASDSKSTQPVIVVNDTLARRHFPGGALGQRIVFEFFDGKPEWTIVGVVGDVQFNDVDKPVAPAVYFPYQQNVGGGVSLVVRTAIPPEQVASGVRAAVAGVDPEVPVAGLRSMERSVADSGPVFIRLFVTRLLAWFSFATLILAGVGVYGMLAESIAAKTREIGVRAALGATRGQIARLVVFAGIVPAGWGLAAGALVVVLAAPALRALLFGVTAVDPLALGAVTAVIAVVALIASAVPAWRAMRLPVTTALRSE
jgi:putative ABC transport system permease protein